MAKSILIVDDSVSMRQMTKLILKSASYQVIEAKDGIEALELLSNSIDLVITDYNMPNMNGITLIKQIRGGKSNKSVPILILTTETDPGSKEEGKKAGATGWLTKPFDKEGLLRVIQKVLGTMEL
jgi:two-component system chemotaxis response regulator CheY